jgi:hypothetical protein
LPTPTLTHLQRLEAESIHIMREVVAETERSATTSFRTSTLIDFRLIALSSVE